MQVPLPVEGPVERPKSGREAAAAVAAAVRVREELRIGLLQPTRRWMLRPWGPCGTSRPGFGIRVIVTVALVPLSGTEPTLTPPALPDADR
jgi:hypothetical protein